MNSKFLWHDGKYLPHYMASHILRQQWMKSLSMSRKFPYLTREASDSFTVATRLHGIMPQRPEIHWKFNIWLWIPPPVTEMWNLPDNQSTCTQIEWTIYGKLWCSMDRIGLSSYCFVIAMRKYERCSENLKILYHKTSKAVAQLQHEDLNLFHLHNKLCRFVLIQ